MIGSGELRGFGRRAPAVDFEQFRVGPLRDDLPLAEEHAAAGSPSTEIQSPSSTA